LKRQFYFMFSERQACFFVLCVALGLCSLFPFAAGAGSPPDSSSSASAPDSGIYGTMVAAWGNQPANPPTYKCVNVFDGGGQTLIATGLCSGIYGQFRIPLAPGRYVVDKSPVYTPHGAPLKPQPGSLTVEVRPGQWINLAPRPLPGPVP
jgi:hypothetical protein